MIEFNSTNNFEIENHELVKSWLKTVANKEGKTLEEVNYVFCNDPYLLELNVKYLEHDTLTDVISFDYGYDEVIVGEVYISIERVRENAKSYKVGFDKELLRVMVHGLLHFCGYGDKDEAEKKQMRAKEDLYLLMAPSTS